MRQNLIDQLNYAGYEEALRQGLKPISGQWDVSSELAFAQKMTKKLQLTKSPKLTPLLIKKEAGTRVKKS